MPDLESPAPSARFGRPATLALLAILVWAGGLRIWVALPNPTATRFWDERWGVENIAHALEAGTLLSANAIHPQQSWIPQAALVGAAEAVHRALGTPAMLAREPGGRPATDLAPAGYHAVRWLQILFALGSLVLAAWLGGRLDRPATGLLAAFLLAAVPWHLRQSVLYKPDILLLLCGLVCLAAADRALRRFDARSFAWAGAAVGLAGSVKYNGLAYALLLVAGTFHEARGRARRAVGLLVVAGLASIATLAALNPGFLVDPGIIARDMGRTLRDYARKGERADTGFLDILLHAPSTLLGPTFHGPLLGGLAFLALALGIAAAVRGRLAPAAARATTMIAGLVAGYVLLYAVATRNPSPHNWLPLVPFTVLALAALLARVPEFAAGWAGRRPPRAVVGAVTAAFLLVASLPVHGWAYREAVPATSQWAERKLHQAFGSDDAGRLVYTEVDLSRFLVGPWVRGETIGASVSPPLVVRVADLAEVDATALAAADGWVAKAGTGAPSRLAAGAGWTVETLAPRTWRARGDALEVGIGRWRRDELGGPARLAAGADAIDIAPLPAVLPTGALVSVYLDGKRDTPRAAVMIGPGRLACDPPPGGAARVCSTPRIPAVAGAPIRIERHAGTGPASARVFLWSPPAEP